MRTLTVTAADRGKRLAILVDAEVLSAPRILAPVGSGVVHVTGRFPPGEAQRLVDAPGGPPR